VYTCVDESGKVNRYSCNPEDLDGINTQAVLPGHFKSRTGYTLRGCWCGPPLSAPALSCGNVNGYDYRRRVLARDGQRVRIVDEIEYGFGFVGIDDEALINWIQGDDL
jgi:hypothetical protein